MNSISFSIVHYAYKNIDNIEVFSIGCELSEHDIRKIATFFKNTIEKPVLISTCAVVESALYASVELAKKIRLLYPSKQIIITGCGVSYQSNLFIDYGISLINKDKFNFCTSFIDSYDEEKNAFINVLDDDNHDIAQIKIQDGCSSHCSYCIIPKLRGNKSISFSYEYISSCIKRSLALGIKRINLIGIEICNYYHNGMSLSELLQNIIKDFPDVSEISFGSLDPSSKQIEQIIDLYDHYHDKICKKLCLSIQSGSNTILKQMNRKYQVDRIYDIHNYAASRGFQIEWHIIVGFPGETDEMFNETILLVKNLKPFLIHINKYSDRQTTLASKLGNKVPEKVKEERYKQLHDLLRLQKTRIQNHIKKYDFNLTTAINVGNLASNEDLIRVDKFVSSNKKDIIFDYNDSIDEKQLELNVKYLYFKYKIQILMKVDIDNSNIETIDISKHVRLSKLIGIPFFYYFRCINDTYKIDIFLARFRKILDDDRYFVNLLKRIFSFNQKELQSNIKECILKIIKNVSYTFIDNNKYIDRNISIYDCFSSRIIAAGKIRTERIKDDCNNDCLFISYDEKIFFNVNSSRLIFDTCQDIEILQFNENYISSYISSNWHALNTKKFDKKSINQIDIVIDDTYNIIDSEIRCLCDAINSKFNGKCITISSCSGHGKDPFHIICQFYDIDSITTLLNVINSNDVFRDNLILSSDKQINRNKEMRYPILNLHSVKAGKEAYAIAKKLACLINNKV